MATFFRVGTFVSTFSVWVHSWIQKLRGFSVGASVGTIFYVGTNVGIFVTANVGTLNILKIY